MIILNNVRVYRFENHKLVGKIDLTQQMGSRTLGKIDPAVFASDGINSAIAPERADALRKLRRAKPSA